MDLSQRWTELCKMDLSQGKELCHQLLHFFENLIWPWEPLLNSWFNVTFTQLSIFILFVSTCFTWVSFPCILEPTNFHNNPKHWKCVPLPSPPLKSIFTNKVRLRVFVENNILKIFQITELCSYSELTL